MTSAPLAVSNSHYLEPSPQMRELRLLELLARQPGTSQSALAQSVGLTSARVNAYIRKFVDERLITTAHRSRGLEYHLTAEGRRCLAYHQVSYRAELVHLTRSATRHFREYFAGLEAKGVRCLALYGAGETGEVVLDVLSHVSGIDVVALVDDDSRRVGSSLNGRVIQPPSVLAELVLDAVVITSITFAEQIRSSIAAQGLDLPIFSLTD